VPFSLPQPFFLYSSPHTHTLYFLLTTFYFFRWRCVRR